MKTTKKVLLTLILGLILFTSCNKKSNKLDLSLIPMKSGDKWEYVDKEGKIIINPQFTFAAIFHEDYALVAAGGDGDSAKVGYINKEGKYIINPIYKSGTYFSEGLACVVPFDGRPTYIDIKGTIKFTLKDAEKASIFKDGRALFSKFDKDGNEIFGYIDNTGIEKINPIYYGAWPFSDGLAAVKNKDNKWGFINKEGILTINFQFEGPGNFIEGKARVYDGKNYGYIDKNGKYVINPQFENAYRFTQDLAAIKQGKSWGFIDKEGKFVINPQFDEVWMFNDDLAAVKSSDKWGYIDKNGKYIINPQFEEVTCFNDDIALVKSNGKVGIINKEGKYLVNPQFDDWSYELCTSLDCIYNIDQYNYSYYANEEVESDFFDVNSIISKIITSASKTEVNSFNSSSKLDDVMTKLSLPDSVLPKSSWEVSFSIKEKKISKDILCDQKYIFKSPINEEIKEITGRNWYGDPTYKVTGYKKSDKALLSSIIYELNLSFNASKKIDVIVKSLISKFEKAGLIKSEKLEEKDKKTYMLISDEIIVIISPLKDYIGIGIYNTNNDGFKDALFAIKNKSF